MLYRLDDKMFILRFSFASLASLRFVNPKKMRIFAPK